MAPRPPVALTNTVSWRSEGIKHRKNEIFLDVIEKLNLLVSSNGTVLHSEIVGAVRMKSFLSGMPELKLGLNDKLMFEATGRPVSKGKAVELEDIKFHQCVRLARYKTHHSPCHLHNISRCPTLPLYDLYSWSWLPTLGNGSV